MPTTVSPEFLRQLAHTLDSVFDQIPSPEAVQRGDDIGGAIYTVVVDIGNVLADVTDVLVAESHEEAKTRVALSAGGRAGAAALTSCAPTLGATLGHLALVVERLGAHQGAESPGPGRRPVPSHDEAFLLQQLLDEVGTLLRKASRRLACEATHLSHSLTEQPRPVPTPITRPAVPAATSETP